jgi:ubiquinone/menaquinone biosynthesis C-methylase UbiE
MKTTTHAVEEQTGKLFGDLWHRYDDHLFKQSVELFGARWRANGEPEDFFRGKRCLDAGCGGGRFSFAMAQMGAASVVGIDVSAEGVADASRRRDALGLTQVSFRQASLLDMPFGDGEFDFVCCSGVLHHTVSVERGLAEIHRVLAPGGSVYLLLYGAGGLYWPLNFVLRTFAQRLGREEVDRCIQAAALPANKRRTILDDLFVPILETYTSERLEFLLRAAGFTRWRRWPAGQLDHESSAETLTAELRLRSELWNAGAASAWRDTAEIESGLALICDAVADVARSHIERHKAGLLSEEALRATLIGVGHHRLIAERS